MPMEPRYRSRLTQELESLRRQIAELQMLVVEPSPASSSSESSTESTTEGQPVTVPAEPPSMEPEIPNAVDLLKLFEKGPFGIAIIDSKATVIDVNEALCRMLDCSKDGLAGRPLAEVSAELGASSWEQWTGKAAAQGFCRFEAHLSKSSGDLLSTNATLSAVRDRQGGISGFAVIFEEIPKQVTTERGAPEPGDDRYRELFENANDMMFMHDPMGNVTSFNKAAETITGYSSGEARQMNIAQILSPEALEAARRQADHQVAGDIPSTYQLSATTKDGRRMTLEISSRLIFRGGRPAEFQSVARDITMRKERDDALQDAKRKLEEWVRELEHRTRQMSLLSELADMLRACYTLDEAYSVIVRIAQQIFPAQVGALYVLAGSRNVLQAVAFWGIPTLAQQAFAPDECWALRRGRMHWVEDVRSGLVCKHLPQPPPAAYLCVPMMAQSEALGVLYLTQAENALLVEAQHRLAVAMAEHIAMALSNLRLHETLRSQSIRDPLTGLFNRRFMEESLELELRRAARGQHGLGIIVLDLDHFDEFNQKAGREAGDTALREIGALLQANIRKEDIVCRWGGHRFAVILPQSTLEVTVQRAACLLEMVKNIELISRNRTAATVAVSLGISVFPQHGRTVDALLRAAEAALQRAQDAGGNQINVAK